MQPTPTFSIRMAVPDDAAALRRLAELDSAPAPDAVPMVVAEVDGELWAALPVHGGRAIADPFRLTGELVALLAERARQLASPPSSRAGWRQRRLRVVRAAVGAARWD